MRGTAPLPFFVISEPRPWITGLCSAPDHLARPSGWDQISGVGAGGGGGLRGFAGQGPGAGWGRTGRDAEHPLLFFGIIISTNAILKEGFDQVETKTTRGSACWRHYCTSWPDVVSAGCGNSSPVSCAVCHGLRMCHGRITVLGGSWSDYLRYRDFYHYRKHKARRDTLMADPFLATMTPKEKTVLGQHMAYTKKLFNQGKISWAVPPRTGPSASSYGGWNRQPELHNLIRKYVPNPSIKRP